MPTIHVNGEDIEIVSDSNWRSHVIPPSSNFNEEWSATGYMPRDWMRHPLGSFTGSVPLPKSMYFDEKQLREIFTEQKAKGTRLLDFINRAPHLWLRQPPTNYCFPSGTLVRMADGTNKPIQQIRVLDEVVTAEGRIGSVTQVMARRVKEPLYKMVCWGHSHLKATGAHPVLTKRGYVRMCDLIPGDKVAFTKYMPQSNSFILTGDLIHERNTVKQSRRVYRNYDRPYSVKRRESSVVGRAAGVVSPTQIPDIIELDYMFGRLVGLFLAEGHTTPLSAHWSLHARERDTLAKDIADALRSLGGDPQIKTRSANCIQVIVHGKGWAQLFESLCSRGSGQKHMHHSIASGPSDFLTGVLEGWMDGDRQLGNSAVSVSRELALNMFDIANAIGKMPILSTHIKAGARKDGINRLQAWKVGWGEGKHLNHGLSQDEKYMWRTVRRIEIDEQQFDGYVFNLEVEGDHSYVAEGVGVHNCWCYGVTHAVMIVRMMANHPFERLSPYSAACIIKNFKNVGGWGSQALTQIVKEGLATEFYWPMETPSMSQSECEAANMRAISQGRQYLESSRVDAAKHKVEEFYDIPDRDWLGKMSCIAHRFPVSCGYNWMGHQMCTVGGEVLPSGEIVCIEMDHYGKAGVPNYRTFTQSRGTPDDATVPVVSRLQVA